MSWQVHYQSDGRQYRASAVDRSAAVAIACILLRDGHDVVKLESLSGETIEAHELRDLCDHWHFHHF
jgi:hypothetical protein